MASPLNLIHPLLLLLISTVRSSTLPEVHDILAVFDLPVGILPDAVKSYTLSDTGDFTVTLESTCYVHFDDQLVYYDDQIKGKLSKGSVTDVSGIQAKKLFIWVSVTGMKVDEGDGTVVFYVGALSEKLPAKLFETVPRCGKKVGMRSAVVDAIGGLFS
ncbi:hypothetical protein Droror1_Dr00016693 [Drosera rotundifolia]